MSDQRMDQMPTYKAGRVPCEPFTGSVCVLNCQRQRRQVTITALCAGWSRTRTSFSRAATNACARRARPPSVSSAQCAAGLRWVCAGFPYDKV